MSLSDEVDEVVDFRGKYLDVLEVDYKRMYYRLLTSPDARKWGYNILLLSQQHFSLLVPFTSSIIERSLSTLKVLKTNRRTSLLPY